MGFRNVRHWRQALDQQHRMTRASMHRAVGEIAEYTRDTIRKRIPPGATTSSGMSNRFPGYAATGSLKSAVVAGTVHTVGNTFVARVGVPASASELNRIKANVHEYGRVIKARRAPYLVFQVEGQWVKVKQVRIRAKRFFRSGWAEARYYFPEAMERLVRSRWPGRS